MEESLPPQCEGPPIVGWDWASVPGERTHRGVTHGTYVVVGTYDGKRFTPTRPATTPKAYDGPRVVLPDVPQTGSPCPVPEGGGACRDPDTTTTATMERHRAATARIRRWVNVAEDQIYERYQAKGDRRDQRPRA